MVLGVSALIMTLASGASLASPPASQPDAPAQAPAASRPTMVARLDALDQDGDIALTVAATFIEPDLLAVHAGALRIASRVQITHAGCDPIEFLGVVAVDPDHKLALIRTAQPVPGAVTVEFAPEPAAPGDLLTAHAIMFALDCGYAAAILDPVTILAAHHLPAHGLIAHVMVPAPPLVHGAAMLDPDGRLVGLLEAGRDGTSSVVALAGPLAASPRLDPMTLEQFHAMPAPAPVLATRSAQSASEARAAGDLPGADRLITEALELDPDSWLAHYELGVVRDLAREPGRAVEALERAIALEPDFCESHYSLGLVHLQQGRPADAVAPLRQASRLNPGHATAMSMLMLALESSGDLDAALEAGEASIALHPRDLTPYHNLAIIYARHGREQDALEVWRRRIEHHPTESEGRGRYGALLLDLEEFDRCIEVLTPLLEDRRADPMILARLAIAQWLSGDRTGAMRTLDLAIERNPRTRELLELRDTFRQGREGR